MTYSVEYRIYTYNTIEPANSKLFSTVDEALDFISKIKDSFKDTLEYAFIHCI